MQRETRSSLFLTAPDVSPALEEVPAASTTGMSIGVMTSSVHGKFMLHRHGQLYPIYLYKGGRDCTNREIVATTVASCTMTRPVLAKCLRPPVLVTSQPATVAQDKIKCLQLSMLAGTRTLAIKLLVVLAIFVAKTMPAMFMRAATVHK